MVLLDREAEGVAGGVLRWIGGLDIPVVGLRDYLSFRLLYHNELSAYSGAAKTEVKAG